MSQRNKVWDLLNTIKNFQHRIDFKYGGISGVVSGTVSIQRSPQREEIGFYEVGKWDHSGMLISNVYRWVLQDSGFVLSQCRLGDDYCTTLVNFEEKSGEFASVLPHVCGDDHYHASLSVQKGKLFLRWIIKGPQKLGTIESIYDFAPVPKIN